jgi:hypothetical protein
MAPRKSAKHSKRPERQSRARLAELRKDGERTLALNDQLRENAKEYVRKNRSLQARLLHKANRHN